jgi:hypothetical protein
VGGEDGGGCRRGEILGHHRENIHKMAIPNELALGALFKQGKNVSRVSRYPAEKHIEARNLTLMSASRPSIRPLSPVEPLADRLVLLLNCCPRNFRNDLCEGLQRGVEIAHPNSTSQVSQ